MLNSVQNTRLHPGLVTDSYTWYIWLKKMFLFSMKIFYYGLFYGFKKI